jgi:tryptophan synthase beta chain
LDLRLKREDLLHGGAHKTNNVIGQGLLAKRMGKTRLIAETGAGQHGVATAMIGARLGLETVIYMGSVDIARQDSNVRRMQLMGARVIPVTEGAATLKEAINEALRDWAQSAATTHYLLGTVCGPDPFPRLVAYFQSVIGIEARSQWEAELGGLPDAVVACIGGGSNAMGIFKGFEEDDEVRLIGVEPAGHGADTTKHGMTLGHGSPGLLHGARTQILQDADGQIGESHSVAAGLDYPGVGPEHAHLKSIGRAEYHAAPDTEALAAFQELTTTEGILPAFESAHALAFCRHAVERGHLPSGAKVLINLSGRGDKDMDTYLELKGGGADES